MIDEKKIEEGARDYINKNGYFVKYDEDPCVDIEVAYKDGAKWAIEQFLKDMWNPNTEEPDKSKSDIITLGFDNDAHLQFKESILWSKESWRHSISRCQITKWVYLSDILPKQEGGEQ